MALSISDILQVSAPAIMHSMGRSYRMTTPATHPNFNGYYAHVCDDRTGTVTIMQWTYEDEIRAVSEAQKISLANALLENAVRSLDDFIARRNEVVDDIIDVEFNA